MCQHCEYIPYCMTLSPIAVDIKLSIVHSHMMWFDWLSIMLLFKDELTVPLCDSVNNVISVPLEGIQNTVYTCWVSMEWSNWWTGMNTVLFIVLPFCLCLSLRSHSHCGECERGDGRGSGQLGEGGGLAWCPTLQTTGDQSTVVHWEREVFCTGRLLGQHWPWCLLGEICQGALPEGRGESTSSDETILAATRYV